MKAKVISIVVALVVLGLAGFVYFRYFFVYGTGINAGEINYFQREGVLFKTYEGKMIQGGFRSTGAGTTGLRSNEFKFSVTDEKVAEQLMHCSGHEVELRWKRYFAPLPWRGNSENVVCELVADHTADGTAPRRI